MSINFLSPNIVECLNFTNGKWVSPSEKLSQLKSPYTAKIIGNTYRSTLNDINLALDSAKKAQIPWQERSIRERAEVLFQFRSWLLSNIDTIAQTVSLESGKLIREAKEGLLKGIEVIEYAMSLTNHDQLTKQQVAKGIYCEYRREPLGVVAGITPSNFPAMVPMWMIPIAITVGNSFIWKPSEKTPLTSILLAEGLQKCGLPDGVLSIIQGDKFTVDALCQHEEIKAIGFVGSTAAAKAVYEKSALSGKRVLALGGAKNHIVLMPDAQKENAVSSILASFTGCAGQRCMAASVLLTVGKCDSYIEELVQRAKAFQITVDIGAIISKESHTKLSIAIEKAKSEGAKILTDGRNITPPKEYSEGHWLNPTILDEVQAHHYAAQEELFGPILSIIRCPDLSHALQIENANMYGNAASIFTTSGDAADYFTNKARAGMIGVNIGVPVPREPFSFGGIAASKFGHGDITGQSGVDFWSLKKKVTTKWSLHSDKSWMS